MYQNVCDKIMLSEVELVCDCQGKVEVEQSKVGRINFNTNLPSFVSMLKNQKT
jgi:hypothetical protein